MSYYDDASLVLIPSGVKAAKVYSQKPTNGTGDLTFSRASTATRTNASGAIESVASNVPRLDYSGGATCPRLLLEPQRTNLVFPSDTATTQTRTVTATAHTLSFYGTGSVTLLGVATGTLTGTGANDRVALTFTPTAGSLVLTVSGTITNWQLEAGSFSSTLIPTTTATVTRLRDDATKSIPTLFSAAAGTFFVDTMPTITTLTNQTIGVVNDGTFNRFFALGFDAGDLKLRARNSGSVLTVATGPTITNGQQIKAIVRFDGVNYTLFANGVKYITGTSPYPSTLNTVTLNGDASFLGAAQHRVNQSLIFPTALSDAQCIELTTL